MARSASPHAQAPHPHAATEGVSCEAVAASRWLCLLLALVACGGGNPSEHASQPYRYAFPVQPPEVASRDRSHHDYPATDVFAPCGAVVVAATDGVVDDVGAEDRWDPEVDDGATRGGLFVSVVGDDGVRYYGSHLREVSSTLAAGQRVQAGQEIGRVGDTGNAAGTGCHLHFGLSPPRGPGDWQVRRGVVYPWPYLDSWRAGGRESPARELAVWAEPHPPADHAGQP